MIQAVLGQGYRLGLTIRRRTRRPPSGSRRRGSDGAAAAILQRRPDETPSLRRRSPIPLQQPEGRRGLVGERGAGAMLPPVLAVPGGELVGERPELGAVEGAELQQAAPAPAEDLLAGQRDGEAELRVARGAGELHRRTRRERRRLGHVHGMGGGGARLGFRGFKQAAGRGGGTRDGTEGRLPAAPGGAEAEQNSGITQARAHLREKLGPYKPITQACM